MLENSTILSHEDIAALVKDFYSMTLAQDDDRRLMADGPDRFREARAEHYRKLADGAKVHLAEDAYGTVRLITSVMLARRYGLDAKFDDRSVRKVGQAMLRAGVEVAETLRARAEGDFNYEPRDKLLVEALRERPEPSASAPPVAPKGEPPVVAGSKFSKAAETFREAQLRRKI